MPASAAPEQASSLAATTAPRAGRLVHVGCGVERLEGWVNVDYELFPSVDVVADMRDPLPFRGVDAVFAEHFLEHLTIDTALAFLESAHQALVDGGWLRLTTPNFEWVWATHYKLDADDEAKRAAIVGFNRGFYAWGHRFLWNQALLAEALHACGFDDVQARPRGESAAPLLQGVERHEPYPDYGSICHVIVVEARKGAPRPARLAALRAELWQGFWSHLDARDRARVAPGGMPLPRPQPPPRSLPKPLPEPAAQPVSPRSGLLARIGRRLFG